MPTPIWTGSLAMGLVSIPIRLYTAVKPKDIRFNLLREEDGVRVRQKYVCPPDEEEVPRESMVRGYEAGPDRYGVVEEALEASLAAARRRKKSA